MSHIIYLSNVSNELTLEITVQLVVRQVSTATATVASGLELHLYNNKLADKIYLSPLDPSECGIDSSGKSQYVLHN